MNVELITAKCRKKNSNNLMYETLLFNIFQVFVEYSFLILECNFFEENSSKSIKRPILNFFLIVEHIKNINVNFCVLIKEN